MIHFSRVSPEVIRRINLSLFEGPVEYVVVDESVDDRAKIRESILSVDESSVLRVLDWIGDVPTERFEWAWAKFMAGNISQQNWPDGNHRTSFLFLNELAKVYFQEEISLSTNEMADLLRRSKAMLQAETKLPDSPVFSLHELNDAAHAYRQLFTEFAEKLVWAPAE